MCKKLQFSNCVKKTPMPYVDAKYFVGKAMTPTIRNNMTKTLHGTTLIPSIESCF